MSKFPPLPDFDCPGVYMDGHSNVQLRARDLEVAKAVLKAAAIAVCNVDLPAGDRYIAGICAGAIRNLEFKHE